MWYNLRFLKSVITRARLNFSEMERDRQSVKEMVCFQSKRILDVAERPDSEIHR